MNRLALALFLWLSLTGAAGAEERILDFQSAIAIDPDGSMVVSETITVLAEGKEIRRGIYRDFPTDYTDRAGNRYRVGFDILAVERDGQTEMFHTEQQGNGVRIYIGNRDRFVEDGNHSYLLRYRTDRQLGFFDRHDELYWNVTGNDWSFPIDRAGAAVSLPAGVPVREIGAEGYTGPTGAKGRDYRATVDQDGLVRFGTTRSLRPREGLTIVVTWPKGFVHEPTEAEKAGLILRDNRHLLVGLAGLLLIAVYYLVTWWRIGRDPEAGIIMPRYQPPAGVSPASMRYVREMGYDHTAFASAVINLAVKGLVKIEEEQGTFRLRRTDLPAKDLSPGEKALLSRLFGGGMSLLLKNTEHRRVGGALKAHENALSLNYEKLYFVTNRRWLIPGILLTIAILVGCVLVLPRIDDMVGVAFITIWLSFWSIGVSALLTRVVQLWRRAGSGGGIGAALITTLFSVPFLAGEGVGIYLFVSAVSWPMLVILAAAVGLNLLFAHLLKAPTRAGRQLLDQVEGFRLYLDVAERDDLNLRHRPERTPELFEKYLPFALALGLEQQWGEQFAGMFAGMRGQGNDYRPQWYSGRRFSGENAGAFAGSLGSSLGASISSSASAPGSSSGSGGGGSSGGGGGGGGGGGW